MKRWFIMREKIKGTPTRENLLSVIDPSDMYWMDRKGKLLHIPHMNIHHVEAVIRYLHKYGIEKDEMPQALFIRYNERHKELGKMIQNLDEEE
jgi:hypothetical protein